MRYSEALKNLWKATTKYESRYALRAIKIDAENKVAVATDGHMLVIVDIESLLDPDDKSFLLPVDALKAARLLYLDEKKRDRTKFKKGMRPIVMRAVDDCVTVFIGASKRGQSFDLISGTYPEWEKVLPAKGKEYPTSITLSLGLLSSLVESMLGNYKRDDAVTISVKSMEEAVLVAANGDFKSYGMLMPMRTEAKKPTQFWKERNKK